MGGQQLRMARVFWFTGLSGVGKSTISQAAMLRLELNGMKVLILDGDAVRSELHLDLGFSESDIKENNRLILELCVKHQKEYDIILVPIISPFIHSRSEARKKLGTKYFEIHLDAGLEILHKRDTKGLYKKARNNQIDNLIGVSKKSRYEPPTNPDLRINTEKSMEENSINLFYNFVLDSYKKKPTNKRTILSFNK